MNKRPVALCVGSEEEMSRGALETSFRAAQLLAEVNEPSETPDRLTKDEPKQVDLTRRPCDGTRSCYCS